MLLLTLMGMPVHPLTEEENPMKRQDSTKTPRLRGTCAGLLAAGLLAGLMINTGVCAAQEEGKIDYGKISLGKSLFRAWCRSCHGESARGDGPMAENLRVAPSDLTLLKQREGGRFYFGRVTAKIDGREKTRGHGSRDMPVWGEAFGLVDEAGGEEAVREKINALVHFLRSIQVTADEGGS